MFLRRRFLLFTSIDAEPYLSIVSLSLVATGFSLLVLWVVFSDKGLIVQNHCSDIFFGKMLRPRILGNSTVPISGYSVLR